MTKLKSHFSYQKFSGDTYRILFLFRDYYLEKESIEALKNLGHEVMVVDIVNNSEKMLRLVLEKSVEFKPDCILSTNHGAFDQEGKIAGILSDLSIPVIVWYLDDFKFIIFTGEIHATDNTAIFTFERNHVDPLKKAGFENSFYLPTASSIDPCINYKSDKYTHLSDSTTFIGSTFESTKLERQREEYIPLIDELEKQVDLSVRHEDLIEKIENIQGTKFTKKDDFYHYASFAVAYATQVYRTRILNKVSASDLCIYGDEKWNELVSGAEKCGIAHGKTEAPSIFASSMINLNICSQQLETSVTLRVFDIPASGGFLLTDWTESLEHLFETGKEVVSFRTPDEMNDLIRYYKTKPGKREEITNRARERIGKEHLMIHRMAELLDTAKNIWS